jgi:hypothetical protein
LRGVEQEQMIKKNHGDEWKFLMALHINDTVSIEKENGDRVFYRVQKLDVSGGLTLRLNTASTIDNKKEEIRISLIAMIFFDHLLLFYTPILCKFRASHSTPMSLHHGYKLTFNFICLDILNNGRNKNIYK